MKKILHIQVLPIFSGVQHISFEILKGLPSTEYDKTIIFSSQGTDEQKQFIMDIFSKIDVRVIFSKYLKREISLIDDWKAFWEIYNICKTEQFDILHTHSTKPGVIGRLAGSFAHVSLVLHTVHGLSFHKFISFPKWQFYWLCEMSASFFCDRIILVNDYYRRYFKIFKSKVQRIYNAIDYSKFFPVQTVSNANGKINILFVGRLDSQKNPLSLLQAAKLVVKERNDVIFTLVGTGELDVLCKQYISDNNLESYVKLAGWSSCPEEFYARADIFVASSIYEAFGLMFLEAGYFALPSCATNVEGIPEVIIDGVTGLLCAPNDEVAMANNILKLCSDKNLRIKMGQAAKEHVINTFSLAKMNKLYKKIYELCE